MEHPLIKELFKLLPPPDTEWSMIQRLRWLNAAEAIFKIVYAPDIAQAAVDMTITIKPVCVDAQNLPVTA